MIGLGQLTYVPDDNFEQKLINEGYDNVLDDYVLTANIDTLISLNLTTTSTTNLITDLTGIEDFTALQYLNFSGHQITTIDLSNNTNLNNLVCYNNQLVTLDVSQNTSLEDLGCSANSLICLDVSSTAITTLSCYDNLLEQLNTKNGILSTSSTFYSIDGRNNNLSCVEVDDIYFVTVYWQLNGSLAFDSLVTFDTDCNYSNPCNSTTAIQELTTNKELLKVTDLLGRETKETNQPLFYIYDDGTVEKRIVIE